MCVKHINISTCYVINKPTGRRYTLLACSSLSKCLVFDMI